MRLFRRRKAGRPHGPWIAWGYTSTGERWTESTQQLDRKAAEAAAREIERRHADPAHARTQAATLNDALKLLLSRCRSDVAATPPKLSAETLTMYEQKAGTLGRTLGLGLLLRDLTPVLVDGHIATRREEKITDHTIHKELTTLRQALTLARRAGIFARDPAEVIPPFTPGYQPRERYLTREDLQKLLAELPANGAALAAFIVATGARWGEAERAYRAGVRELGAVTVVHLRGTKTDASDRTVPIVHPEALSLLKYALEHAAGCGDPLFAPWKSPNNALRRACERAKITHASWNDLRRTFATWLRQAGVAPSLIAPAMGHTSSAMVERVYGRLPADDLARLLGAAFGAATRAADMQQTPCTGADSADSVDTPETKKAPISRGFVVGHDRLELSANGLRVRSPAPTKALWPRPKRETRAPRAANVQQPDANRRAKG